MGYGNFPDDEGLDEAFIAEDQTDMGRLSAQPMQAEDRASTDLQSPDFQKAAPASDPVDEIAAAGIGSTNLDALNEIQGRIEAPAPVQSEITDTDIRVRGAVEAFNRGGRIDNNDLVTLDRMGMVEGGLGGEVKASQAVRQRDGFVSWFDKQAASETQQAAKAQATLEAREAKRQEAERKRLAKEQAANTERLLKSREVEFEVGLDGVERPKTRADGGLVFKKGWAGDEIQDEGGRWMKPWRDETGRLSPRYLDEHPGLHSVDEENGDKYFTRKDGVRQVIGKDTWTVARRTVLGEVAALRAQSAAEDIERVAKEREAAPVLEAWKKIDGQTRSRVAEIEALRTRAANGDANAAKALPVREAAFTRDFPDYEKAKADHDAVAGDLEARKQAIEDKRLRAAKIGANLRLQQATRGLSPEARRRAVEIADAGADVAAITGQEGGPDAEAFDALTSAYVVSGKAKTRSEARKLALSDLEAAGVRTLAGGVSVAEERARQEAVDAEVDSLGERAIDLFRGKSDAGAFNPEAMAAADGAAAVEMVSGTSEAKARYTEQDVLDAALSESPREALKSFIDRPQYADEVAAAADRLARDPEFRARLIDKAQTNDRPTIVALAVAEQVAPEKVEAIARFSRLTEKGRAWAAEDPELRFSPDGRTWFGEGDIGPGAVKRGATMETLGALARGGANVLKAPLALVDLAEGMIDGGAGMAQRAVGIENPFRVPMMARALNGGIDDFLDKWAGRSTDIKDLVEKLPDGGSRVNWGAMRDPRWWGTGLAETAPTLFASMGVMALAHAKNLGPAAVKAARAVAIGRPIGQETRDFAIEALKTTKNLDERAVLKFIAGEGTRDVADKAAERVLRKFNARIGFGVGTALEAGGNIKDARQTRMREGEDMTAGDYALASVASVAGGAVESMDALVFGAWRKVFSKAPDAVKVEFAKGFGQVAKQVAKGAAGRLALENVQEQLQGAFSNAAAKFGWDPGQDWTEGALETAILTTALMGLGEATVQTRPLVRAAKRSMDAPAYMRDQLSKPDGYLAVKERYDELGGMIEAARERGDNAKVAALEGRRERVLEVLDGSLGKMATLSDSVVARIAPHLGLTPEQAASMKERMQVLPTDSPEEATRKRTLQVAAIEVGRVLRHFEEDPDLGNRAGRWKAVRSIIARENGTEMESEIGAVQLRGASAVLIQLDRILTGQSIGMGDAQALERVGLLTKVTEGAGSRYKVTEDGLALLPEARRQEVAADPGKAQFAPIGSEGRIVETLAEAGRERVAEAARAVEGSSAPAPVNAVASPVGEQAPPAAPASVATPAATGDAAVPLWEATITGADGKQRVVQARGKTRNAAWQAIRQEFLSSGGRFSTRPNEAFRESGLRQVDEAAQRQAVEQDRAGTAEAITRADQTSTEERLKPIMEAVGKAFGQPVEFTDRSDVSLVVVSSPEGGLRLLVNPSVVAKMSDEALVRILVGEELLHARTLQDNDRARALWVSLPDSLKAAMGGAYRQVVADIEAARAAGEGVEQAEANAGHEFIRFLFQPNVRTEMVDGKLRVSWTDEGGQATSEEVNETLSKTLAKQIVDGVKALLAALKRIGEVLRAELAPEQAAAVEAEIDRWRTDIRAFIEGLSVQETTKEGGEQNGQDQEGQGREEVLSEAPAPASAPVEGGNAATGAPAAPQGATFEAFGPESGRKATMRLRVLDLADVRGNEGTDLQPRDRARAGYEDERVQMARGFRPQMMGMLGRTDSGPIIVGGEDARILSGHGRRNALRTIFTNPALREKADEVRAYVVDFFRSRGMETEAQEAQNARIPAIGAELTDLGDYAGLSSPLKAFVDDANPGGAKMSDVEDAQSDARNPEVVALLDRVTLDENGDVEWDDASRQAVGELLRIFGRNEFSTADGRPTPEFFARLGRAMLAHVLGPERVGVLTPMIEQGGDSGIANFTRAIIRQAPLLAKLKATGSDLVETVVAPLIQQYVQWKREGGKGTFAEFIGQQDMFREGGDERVARLARAIGSASGTRAVETVLQSIQDDQDYVGKALFAQARRSFPDLKEGAQQQLALFAESTQLELPEGVRGLAARPLKPNHIVVGLMSFPDYIPLSVEQLPYDGSKDGAATGGRDAYDQISAAGGVSRAGSIVVATDASGRIKWVVSPNGKIADVNTPDGQYSLGDLDAFKKDRARRANEATQRGDLDGADKAVLEEVEASVKHSFGPKEWSTRGEFEDVDDLLEARAWAKEKRDYREIDDLMQGLGELVSQARSRVQWKLGNWSKDLLKARQVAEALRTPEGKRRAEEMIAGWQARMDAQAEAAEQAMKAPIKSVPVTHGLKAGQKISIKGLDADNGEFVSAHDYGFREGPRAVVRYYGRLRTVPMSQIREFGGATNALPDSADPTALFAQAPAFYSSLERVLDEKIQGRMAMPQQVKALLRGAKPEEVKWSGIEQAIDRIAAENGGKVPKDALLSYLRDEGAVRFEEVVKGGKNTLRQIGPDTWEILSPRGVLLTEFRGPRESAEANIQRYSEANGEPRFASYQLPGGSNYREVVLAMPVPPMNETTSGWKIVADPDKAGKFALRNPRGAIIETNMTQAQARKRLSVYGEVVRADVYTSSHFPDVPNYVAHMRVNEREDASGKPGLFIEEIQSDRHQAGRDRGYRRSVAETTDLQRNLDAAVEAEKRAHDQVYAMLASGDKETLKAASKVWSDAQSAVDAARAALSAPDGGTPDAPFRKDWPLAMFKRALRDAVAAGKSWVGWTSGQTQADRYDLSKQVDQIDYRPSENGDGRFDIRVWTKGGSDTINKDGLTVDEVSEFVGKDIAQKVAQGVDGKEVDKSYRALRGVDLKVGGEGMKGFYDNILVREIGKYVKQWGAAVSQGQVTTGAEAMADTALEDMLEYAPPGLSEAEMEEFFESAARVLGGVRNDGKSVEKAIADEKAYGDARYAGMIEAEYVRRSHGFKNSTPIWKVEITPAMRESVEQRGQALFAQTAPEPDAADLDRATKGYRALWDVYERTGKLTPDQWRAFERWERVLGQKLLFDLDREAPADTTFTLGDDENGQPVTASEAMAGEQRELFAQIPEEELTQIRDLALAMGGTPSKAWTGGNAWVLWDGRWLNVGDHKDAIPEEFFEGKPWWNDDMSAYDPMLAAGFARVTVGYNAAGRTLYVEYDRLTPQQRREIKDTAIERGMQLYEDRARSRNALFAQTAMRQGEQLDFDFSGDSFLFSMRDVDAQRMPEHRRKAFLDRVRELVGAIGSYQQTDVEKDATPTERESAMAVNEFIRGDFHSMNRSPFDARTVALGRVLDHATPRTDARLFRMVGFKTEAEALAYVGKLNAGAKAAQRNVFASWVEIDGAGNEKVLGEFSASTPQNMADQYGRFQVRFTLEPGAVAYDLAELDGYTANELNSPVGRPWGQELLTRAGTVVRVDSVSRAGNTWTVKMSPSKGRAKALFAQTAKGWERFSTEKAFSTASSDEQAELWRKLARMMPTYQGGKQKMAVPASGGILRVFSKEDLERFDTVVDYFGGGGSWGMFLALAHFPNVRRMVVYEQNAERLGKIKLFHERGNEVGALLQSTGLAGKLVALGESIDAERGPTSGSALKDRMGRIRYDYNDQLQVSLYQSLWDYVNLSRGKAQKSEEMDGEVADKMTARAVAITAVRMVIEQASESYDGAQKFRDRGGVIEHLAEDSYAAAPIEGDNVLAVADPPYYMTAGYLGKMVGVDVYEKTAALIERLAKSRNGIIYTDSAFWIDDADQLNERTDGLALGDDVKDRPALEKVFANLTGASIIPISDRHEILGLYNPRLGASGLPAEARQVDVPADGSGQTDRGGDRAGGKRRPRRGTPGKPAGEAAAGVREVRSAPLVDPALADMAAAAAPKAGLAVPVGLPDSEVTQPATEVQRRLSGALASLEASKEGKSPETRLFVDIVWSWMAGKHDPKRPKLFDTGISGPVPALDVDEEARRLAASERARRGENLLGNGEVRAQVGPDMERRLDDLLRKAKAEISGSRTVGDPRLGFSMDNDQWRAMDAYRKEQFQREKEDEWSNQADFLLESDYEGVKAILLAKSMAGESLDPVMTKAAQRVIASEIGQVQTEARRREVQFLIFAYRETGTAAGRSMAARVDRLMKPAARWREFVGKAIFNVPPRVHRMIAEAPADAEVARRIADLERKLADAIAAANEAQRRVVEAEIAALNATPTKEVLLDADYQARVKPMLDRLASLGISIEDVMGGKVEFSLVGAKIVKDAAHRLGGWKENAANLIRAGIASSRGESGAEIISKVAKRTGRSREDIKALMSEMRKDLADGIRAKVKAGFGIDAIKDELALRAQGEFKERSDEETEAEIERMIAAMGFPEPERFEKMKIGRKRKKKGQAPQILVRGGEAWAGRDWDAEYVDPYPDGRLNLSQPPPPVPDGSGGRAGGTDTGKLALEGTERWEGMPEGIGGRAGGTGTGRMALGDTDAWEGPVGQVVDTDSNTDRLHAMRLLSTVRGGTWVDYATEIGVANLLSAPLTFLTNLTGYGYAAYEIVFKRGIEALINSAARTPNAATFAEFVPMLRALPSAWARAKTNAEVAWDTESPAFERDVLDGEVTEEFKSFVDGQTIRAYIPDEVKFGRLKVGKQGGEDILAAAMRLARGKPSQGVSVGRTVRIPFKVLLATDDFAKSFLGTVMAAGYAHRAGKAAGLDGEALTSFISGELQPGTASWAAAATEAERVSYQKSLRNIPTMEAEGEKGAGWLAEAALRALQDLKTVETEGRPWWQQIGVLLLRTMFPFIKTPYRLLEIGLQETLPGAMLAEMKAMRGQTIKTADGRKIRLPRDKAQAIKTHAHALTALLMAGALAAAAEGDDDDDEKAILITGSMPPERFSKGERQLAMRTMPPYTIRVGPVQIDYRRFDPFSTVLATTVDAVREVKLMRKGKAGKNAGRDFSASFYNQILDKASLRGFSELASLLGGKQDFREYATQQVAAWTVPNAFKSIARAADPLIRDTRTEPLSGTAIASQFAPGPWTGLPARVGPTGEPIEKGGNWFTRALLPGRPEFRKRINEVDAWFVRYNRANPNNTYAPTLPEPEFRHGGVEYRLTADQYQRTFMPMWAANYLGELAARGVDLTADRPDEDQRTKEEAARRAATMQSRKLMADLVQPATQP